MLPKRFEFLNSIGTLPKLVSAAIQYLGIKEIPGTKSNPVIINMANSIGLKGIYSDDDIAWCAVFINFICFLTGKPLVEAKGDLYNLMRASSFLTWGNKVEIKNMQLGDIGILKRDGGYHVFLIIGKTPTGNVIGLGGNQSNSVTFSEFDIKRLEGVRRFYATAAPDSAKLYTIESDGKVSANEA